MQVVASLGNQVAAWVCSSADATRWRVHTTLNIAKDVMTLDCASGIETLVLFRLALSNTTSFIIRISRSGDVESTHGIRIEGEWRHSNVG